MRRFQLLSYFVSSALLALAFAGCATDTQPSGNTGALSLGLVLEGDVQIDEVDWQITGNDMDMSGTIDVSAPGSTASVEVFGLLPGDGYLVELSASSVDGETTCAGSAPFSVEVGVSTPVMVILNCKLPQRLGGVRVNGKFNICAEVSKMVVSPLQTSVGNDMDLLAEAIDVEGDPITFMWTSNSGTIANPMATETTYTCTEVGDDEITVLVTDDGGTYCMSMRTIPVTCVAGDVDLCEGVTCEDDGNECTAEACNPATGECETSNVENGTECDGGAGSCVDGECVAGDLCEGVTCEDDGNECTAEACNPATGECETSNVENGTACGDGGACLDGTCVQDLCEDVVCDPTGNECTTAMCNSQTGECDVMNVPDGTECNDGAGACSNGECIDDNLCDGVDCTSANQCVGDGTCDPATGECIPGDNVAAGTACDQNGTVCDGQGNCVECVGPAQCPDDGNACTAATCEANTCGQSNLMDGASCDFMGSAGVCEAGMCVAAPECLVDADCDDGNVCTLDECSAGTCIYEGLSFGSCEVSPGVPGECSAGVCVGLCEDVVCDDGNECTDDACDPATGECEVTNVPDGTECDGGAGICTDGVCEAASDPVIGPGSGTTSHQALPTTATGCTYNAAETTCTGCTITGPSVPGGGQCGQFGAQIVGGCEVPGGVLNAQLAIDTTISVDVSSDGAGNLTHDVSVVASNPALGTAAGLVTVDAASIFARVTSGVPGQLQNDLNAAFSGRLLGEFTLGGNTLTLDSNAATGIGIEIPTATTAVTPTSSPSVAIDYDNFSLTLTIQASGTPLVVDDAGCIFDLPGAPITLPVE